MITIQMDEFNPHIITINGIRVSTMIIPMLLKPREDALFSFHRNKEYIKVTQHDNLRSCRKFFMSQGKPEAATISPDLQDADPYGIHGEVS